MCINRLEEPTSGKIILDGIEVTDSKVDINKIRQRIGIVFQQFNLFPHLKALQNITLAPTKIKKMDKREAEELAMGLLEKVGLADKADYYPAQLSGGAAAEGCDSKVTSALDPELVKEVLDHEKSRQRWYDNDCCYT